MAERAQRSRGYGILGSTVCVPLNVGVAIIALLGFLGTAQTVGIEVATASPSTSSTVWLCRPGLSSNPCRGSLTTTVVRANGTTHVQHPRPAQNPAIDCFYVYPTVSTQPTANANLHVDPQERAVAIAQASRFSQVCRVYAPMYPQLTISAISKGIRPQSAVIAYLGVLSAWKDYLAHYNDGRGVVLIGHSQGASLLIGLIKREIDPSPTERHLLVSALLMGGNVTVPMGRDVGGDFAHIPACQSNIQTGCVLAYSSFNSPPPANSFFGRVGTSISALSGLAPTSAAGLQVLCTNPAALTGGAGPLNPYFPTEPFAAHGPASNMAPPRSAQFAHPGCHIQISIAGNARVQVERPGYRSRISLGRGTLDRPCSLCLDPGGDSTSMTSILPWEIWSKWCETNRLHMPIKGAAAAGSVGTSARLR